MNESQLKAQVKAAAWGLVALVGINRAIEILNGIVSELRSSQWQGPGDR